MCTYYYMAQFFDILVIYEETTKFLTTRNIGHGQLPLKLNFVPYDMDKYNHCSYIAIVVVDTAELISQLGVFPGESLNPYLKIVHADAVTCWLKSDDIFLAVDLVSRFCPDSTLFPLSDRVAASNKKA